MGLIFIRSEVHDTTTIDGTRQRDPRGLHVTFCYKDQSQTNRGTHVACHGYVTDEGLLSALQTRSRQSRHAFRWRMSAKPLAWRGSVLAFSVGVYCADDATGNITDGENALLSLNSVEPGVNTPPLRSQNNVSDNSSMYQTLLKR
ncbi:hypothetical protein CEP54_008827 [Fusarium duplospermum]|uniref:Uncharacterized protein n=1 Tax=Fusarium duplospermum TaxID=1325734 RepID=A0A428PTL4_9HYPO|nr:hypothetical protein CEP54_008827 [Fusarium duplospermum]